MRRTLAALLVPSALLLLVLVNHWPRFISPIEWSHLQHTLALVDRGTFEVSREVAVYGPHGDLSAHEGQVYSNKAPGLSWLAVPAVALLRVVEKVTGKPPSLTQLLWACRTLACLLPLLVFVPWFVAERQRRGDPPALALLSGVALLAGTPALVYADLLTAQLPAGLAAYAGGAAILDRRHTRAGLLLGLSVLLQYPMLLVAAAFSAMAPLAEERPARLRAWGRLALGAAGPALALAAYNTLCFGGPFELSSRHEASTTYQEISRSGLAGISLPRPEPLYGLLLSPARGLFFVAPVLLLSLAGLVWLAKRRDRRLEAVLLSVGFLVPALTFAGYENWHGGSSFGPRYLIPVLPFLAAALSGLRLPGAPERAAGVTGAAFGLVLAGFFPVACGLLSIPWVPYLVDDPGANFVHTFLLPMLTGGRAPTWLDAVSLPGLSWPVLVLLATAIAAGVLYASASAATPPRRYLSALVALAVGFFVVSVQSVVGVEDTPGRQILRSFYVGSLVDSEGKALPPGSAKAGISADTAIPSR